MTQEWSSETMDAWVAEQVEAGRDEWTVSDVTSALASLFPTFQLGRRSVYQICQQYVGVMGVVPKRRMRGNFSENVFTPAQVGEILLGVQRRQGGSSTYAEVFAALRDQHSGKVAPEPAPADPTAALLSEVRRVVREEFAQLQEASVVSRELTQEPTRSGDDLWRVAMVVMNLSVHDGAARMPEMMNYLGVRDPEAELERMRQFKMDEVLSG